MLHKRYMILRTIGQGGMGAVYQGKDMKRDATCAIKEMSLSAVPANEQGQAVQNFLAEATILSRLNHPNLPTFTDFFSEGDRHFLVMEFIDGSTLEDMLEQNKGPFPERRVLGWARQLCDVLEYLHNQQPPVIFRDLKPGNIMLRTDGRIKLVDFGIARLVRPRVHQDTQQLGTPGFAPPEQYGTAQTDERSDIYSLAMTLFQLLTDTLPDKGFGLPDARTVNSEISATVAHALQKAASLDAEMRYENIGVLRRALFRVGTFSFENGKEATTPEELAELCARYPEEASDYLYAGEVESWFQEIGATELARTARRIRTTTGAPEQGVERLVQAVMGPGAHLRTTTSSQVIINKDPRSGKTGAYELLLPKRGIRARQAPPLIVRPAAIDFGEVYPGKSAPMLLTIAGNQGASIQGTLRPIEPWIITDQTSFDGMSTLVRVRVDSTRLRGSMHYTGSIVITPDDESTSQPITVKVNVDVLGYTSGKLTGPADKTQDRLAASASASAGGQMMAAQSRAQAAATAPPAYSNPQDAAYKAKYGQPGSWDSLQATPRQRRYMQWGLTFTTAFMAASLFYLLFAHLPLFAKTLPLAPNPWFVVVLLGLVPLAVLGALLINSRTLVWNGREMLNRACVGLVLTFTTVSLGELVWHSAFTIDLPVLHLVSILTLTALGAAFGTSPSFSARLLKWVTWGMKRMRLVVLGLAMLTGAGLGLGLTASAGLTIFTPFGVIAGAAVALALIFRVDRLISHP